MSMREWFGKEMGKLFSKSKRSGSTKSKRRSGGNPYEVTEGEMSAPQPHFKQYSPVHSDSVTSVCSVANGLCLSGGKDQIVCIYDYNNGQIKQQWVSHDRDVTKVTYGPRIDCYFSASRDKTTNMYRLGADNPAVRYTGHELVVTGITLNPENSQLCTGSRDNSVKLWDIQTGECIRSKVISRNLISHVHWSSDGDLIAQCGEDKELRMFDSRSLDVVKTFPRKQYIQTWCDISGYYCVTSSNGFSGSGCEATLWDIRNSSIVHEFKGHFETCNCARFVPSQISGGKNLIVTCSNDCSVKVWDRDTRECLSTVDLPGSGPLTSIAIFEDGSLYWLPLNKGQINQLTVCESCRRSVVYRLCVSSFNIGIQVLQMSAKSNMVTLQRTAAF